MYHFYEEGQRVKCYGQGDEIFTGILIHFRWEDLFAQVKLDNGKVRHVLNARIFTNVPEILCMADKEWRGWVRTHCLRIAQEHFPLQSVDVSLFEEVIFEELGDFDGYIIVGDRDVLRVGYNIVSVVGDRLGFTLPPNPYQ